LLLKHFLIIFKILKNFMEVVIKLRVPKDLAEDLKKIEEKEFTLFASRIIKEKLEEIISLYKEVKKSKLSKIS